MAGGSGTRFWPWSRRAKPKQLLPLAAPESMLAETAARVRSIIPRENILIVTSKALARDVHRTVPWLPKSSILAEPVGRNTAPCVAWAAVEVAARHPQGAMIVLPSDHVVAPESVFRQDVLRALTLADAEGVLVTFGIRPDHPATGYGYIRSGDVLPRASQLRARRVKAFKEKPKPAVARRYVASGNYLWNAGIFAWRADAIMEAFQQFQPKILSDLARMDKKRSRGRIPQATVDRAYPKLENISVDHAIMEKAPNVVVLPARFDWNDIGSWNAVAEIWPTDDANNSSRDEVIALDSSNNVIATDGTPVALLGVHDLAIVKSDDVIFVCPRDRAEDVRAIVAELSETRRDDLL